MADAFYPFVGEGPVDMGAQAPRTSPQAGSAAGADGHQVRKLGDMVQNPARIAVFDDPAAAPRVIVIQPKDVRSYLEEVTATVTKLAKEQGGRISFSVIREVVENLVHAYFIEPTISILDGGNTIRFSDQGPGIAEKDRALEYGTTSATEEMKRYIRGVGSGLPYAQQYMEDHGGTLTIEDNISSGTIVTISMPDETGGWSARGVGRAGASAQAVGGAGRAGVIAQAGGTAPLEPYAQQQAVPYVQVPGAAAGWVQQVPAPVQQQVAAQVQQVPVAAPMQQQVAAQVQQVPVAPPVQQGAYPQYVYPAATLTSALPYPVTQGTPSSQAVPIAPGSPVAQGTTVLTGPQGAVASAAAGATIATALTPGQGSPASIELSERARQAIEWLSQHETGGPTDLAGRYGGSLSTWTRQLKELEEMGVVRKQGQKRRLTELGKMLAQS